MVIKVHRVKKIKHEGDRKRLFFGAESFSPWPKELPEGRIISESSRHMTLAFLGHTSFSRLQEVLKSFPAPTFRVGRVGQYDECLFLPKKNPRVIAWHVKWFGKDELALYQAIFASWLREHDYDIEKRPFLPHVTVARSPFAPSHWKKIFTPLPVVISAINLYESVGNLCYESRWKYSFVPPFEELEHTADRAFCVRGENLKALHLHAQVALAFVFPPVLSYFSQLHSVDTLEEVIINLNRVITRTDKQHGCPIKAVSFYGEAKKSKDNLLEWEMIIDV